MNQGRHLQPMINRRVIDSRDEIADAHSGFFGGEAGRQAADYRLHDRMNANHARAERFDQFRRDLQRQRVRAAPDVNIHGFVAG